MNPVTPENAPEIEGAETPSKGLSGGPYSVEELASALGVTDILRNVPAPTIRAIAERVVSLGWVHRDEVHRKVLLEAAAEQERLSTGPRALGSRTVRFKRLLFANWLRDRAEGVERQGEL